MGAKPSRKKSDGAGALSEQKPDDPEVDIMPAGEARQVDITPTDFTTQAVVNEEPEAVLNKSMATMKAKMASVSVEDPTELVAAVPDPEAKCDLLTGFYQEASTKIEISIPDARPIPREPLTTEDREHGADTTVGGDKVMENEALSVQEVTMMECVNQHDVQQHEPLN